MADVNLSMAEIETALGATFNPPPENCPASRALYDIYVSRCLDSGKLHNAYLLAGGLPDAVAALHHSTQTMRVRYSMTQLRRLAKRELKNAE